jgi:hypothetical protein
MMQLRAALAALVWLAAASVSLAQPLLPEQSISKQVVSVGSGTSYVRYLLLAPQPSVSPRPTTALVLFAGSTGRLALNSQGDPTTGLAGNFLVRMRMLFARHNLFVAVVDMPNGVNQHARLSPDHAAAMIGLLADLRTRIGAAKIWVVGTSSGALSAVNIAGRYPQLSPGLPTIPRPVPNSSRPNGVVLAAAQTDIGSSRSQDNTSTTTCTATIFDPRPLLLPEINVPVYLTADRDDDCPCSPPKRTKDIFTALTASPAKAMSIFPLDGSESPPGEAGLDPCTALTPHGFYMIEDGVVAAIVSWAKTH